MSLQNMKRGSTPSFDRVKAICDVLGLECYVGTPRALNQTQTLGAQFDPIMCYQNDDNLPDRAEVLAPIAFQSSWMKEHLLKNDSCVVMNMTGDTMSPTLTDGDTLLVDMSAEKKQIVNMRIYAFKDIDGVARVTRLEQVADHLIIRSDGSNHTTETRTPLEAIRVKVIGRVVWGSRDLI